MISRTLWGLEQRRLNLQALLLGKLLQPFLSLLLDNVSNSQNRSWWRNLGRIPAAAALIQRREFASSGTDGLQRWVCSISSSCPFCHHVLITENDAGRLEHLGIQIRGWPWIPTSDQGHRICIKNVSATGMELTVHFSYCILLLIVHRTYCMIEYSEMYTFNRVFNSLLPSIKKTIYFHFTTFCPVSVI